MSEKVGTVGWIESIENTRKGQARLPELRSSLADFILVNHPGLPLVEGSEKQQQRADHGVLYDFAYFGKPYNDWAMLSHTALRVLVPLSGRATTEIHVTSTAFPVDDLRQEDIVFLFEFPEMDLRCRLGARHRTDIESQVMSVSRDSEPFTMHTPTGSRMRSWPKWTRDITGCDVDEITTILQRKDLTVVPGGHVVLRQYKRY